MAKETNLRILKPHNFTKNLKQLKTFADDNNEISKLEMYKEEDKILWLIPIDHSATGKDLNQLAKWTQNELKKLKEELLKIKKEFITIYDCFVSLDKDYIQAINLNSVEARAIAEVACKNSDKLEQAVKKFKYDYDNLKEKIELHNNISKCNFARNFIQDNSWIIIIFLTIITLFSFIINILFLIGVIK